MKNLHIAIIFSLVCAGCIALPVPEHAADYSDRAPIGEESLEFLEVGSTKREEVVLNLGRPNYTRDNERAFVYEWDTESAWLVTVFVPYCTTCGPKKIISYKTYELLIEFDDIGIVKGFEIKEEEGPSSEKELF